MQWAFSVYLAYSSSFRKRFIVIGDMTTLQFGPKDKNVSIAHLIYRWSPFKYGIKCLELVKVFWVCKSAFVIVEMSYVLNVVVAERIYTCPHYENPLSKHNIYTLCVQICVPTVSEIDFKYDMTFWHCHFNE